MSCADMAPLLPFLRTHVPLRLLLALVIGAAGGYLFYTVHMPLAWMMGSMVATTIASLSGVALIGPKKLRMAVIPVLGVMLGAAFTPSVIDSLGAWVWTLVGLLIYAIVVTAVVTLVLEKGFGYDRRTAFLSSAPGGVNDLVLLSAQFGADERTVSLMHSLRILLAVMVIPLWFRFVEGVQTTGGSGPSGGVVSFDALSRTDGGLLVGCALVGMALGRLLRLPAWALFGPMAVSIAAHLAGLTRASPPTVLVAAAQVVLGTAIGCRFAGLPVRRVLRDMAVGVGTGLLMIGLVVVIALGLSAATGVGMGEIVLAFAPGGLMEMSLVGLAMGFDPAFVSGHHLARIVLVVLLAPLVFRLFILPHTAPAPHLHGAHPFSDHPSATGAAESAEAAREEEQAEAEARNKASAEKPPSAAP